MHPVEDIRGVKSNRLKAKKIVLGVTGSIAAVETVKLCRELIRHGAEVIPVMTHSASKIIHPDSLWFATGYKPIVALSGKTEHVFYCGKTKKPADLLLISPCTANTVSKIAHGIDDTPVTTFATTAIGSKIPVILVPAMHVSMYSNKIIQRNIKICKQNNIDLIEPKIEGNKAKLPGVDRVVAQVFRKTGEKKLKNKKILIIGGGSSEKIDNVRVISNLSSGKTAMWFSKNSYYLHGEVELWIGQNSEMIPDYIKTKKFKTLNDLEKLIDKNNLKKYDYIFVCAALSDYIPVKQKGKIKSDKNKINLELKKATKIINSIRKHAPNSVIIGFKMEDDKKLVKQESMKLLKNNNLNFVVGNTTKAFDNDSNEIWLFNKKGIVFHKKDSKENLTNHIIKSVIKQ